MTEKKAENSAAGTTDNDARRSPSARPARAPRDTRPAGSRSARPQRAPRSHPVLEQLAALYPQLFGAEFRPLKRGIFQDILSAHPDAIAPDGLKEALALHTRSTRYLTSVAAGQPRHDLQGQAVEAMAPEHVHHALLEVFRRRQGRGGEDLRPKLVERIVKAVDASGLTPDDYAARVRGRDEAASAVLDEALLALAARRAKDEALLRAFEAGTATVDAFAAMYGLDPRAAARTLERARQRRSPAAAPAPSAETAV